jgi:hypothetical protein
MLKPEFKDELLEEQINHQGYVVIPGFLSSEQLYELQALYRASHSESACGCWNSIYDLPTGQGKAISDVITSTIKPNIEALFKDCNMPVAIFIVKNPGQGHESLVHRDDTMHDETKAQYRQCWVPLVDIIPENGPLYVVPRSHTLFTDERPMFAPWPFEHLRSRLEQEFHTLYPKAGDLVVYFEKTLHGSFLNHSNETRPVFQGGVMHKDATPWFTRLVPERSEVLSFEVDYDFFFNKGFLDNDIERKYPLVRTETYAPRCITEDELDMFYNAKTAIT